VSLALFVLRPRPGPSSETIRSILARRVEDVRSSGSLRPKEGAGRRSAPERRPLRSPVCPSVGGRRNNNGAASSIRRERGQFDRLGAPMSELSPQERADSPSPETRSSTTGANRRDPSSDRSAIPIVLTAQYPNDDVLFVEFNPVRDCRAFPDKPRFLQAARQRRRVRFSGHRAQSNRVASRGVGNPLSAANTIKHFFSGTKWCLDQRLKTRARSKWAEEIYSAAMPVLKEDSLPHIGLAALLRSGFNSRKRSKSTRSSCPARTAAYDSASSAGFRDARSAIPFVRESGSELRRSRRLRKHAVAGCKMALRSNSCCSAAERTNESCAHFDWRSERCPSGPRLQSDRAQRCASISARALIANGEVQEPRIGVDKSRQAEFRMT